MRSKCAGATLRPSAVRRLLPALCLAIAAPAAAQTFNEVAEDASEVPGDLRYFGRALWERCDEGSAAERRRCERRRRSDARALRATLWLASLPAEGNLEIGPYETIREGFLVRVPHLVLQANGGVLSTRPPTSDPADPGVLAERFFVVPPERAERWFRRNAIDRVRLRLVFRVGRDWSEGQRRGALIELVGVQAYNASTGNVLVDSLSAEEPTGGGPVDLTDRVTLWEPTQLQEARWRVPDGTVVLFSVRVDRTQDGVRHPVLVETRGVERRDLARFEAAAEQDASLALARLGPDRILAIFTDRRPSGETPGHGFVHLYLWRDGHFTRAAQWEGSNDQPLPGWVTDPRAPLPSDG